MELATHLLLRADVQPYTPAVYPPDVRYNCINVLSVLYALSILTTLGSSFYTIGIPILGTCKARYYAYADDDQ